MTASEMKTAIARKLFKLNCSLHRTLRGKDSTGEEFEN
jgi:hypothetical protein